MKEFTVREDTYFYQRYMVPHEKFSYVSLSCVFSKLTSAPSSETLNPSNSVGMVFSFCAFFSAIISSARNSTSSFSAKKNNYNRDINCLMKTF